MLQVRVKNALFCVFSTFRVSVFEQNADNLVDFGPRKNYCEAETLIFAWIQAKIFLLLELMTWQNFWFIDSSAKFSLFIRIRRRDADQDEELLRRDAQQCRKVADKAVDVPFTRRFGNNVLVVIIPKSPRQLFVVHFRFLFANTPLARNLQNQIYALGFTIFFIDLPIIMVANLPKVDTC